MNGKTIPGCSNPTLVYPVSKLKDGDTKTTNGTPKGTTNVLPIDGKAPRKLRILFSNSPLRATPASGVADERGDEREEVAPMEINIPGINGQLFAFKVSGDSMFPTFENGDLVLCEPVHDAENINSQDAYVFQSASGLYLKRIRKAYNDDRQLIAFDLISDNDRNPEYAPFSVAAEEFQKCMRVKMRLTANL